MKKLILLLLVLMPSLYYAQQFTTRNGMVGFEASVSGFDPVEANTHSASAILDASSGTVASLVFVNGFRFKIGLMQEHFNENYMETPKYPKATFKGNIEGFEKSGLSENSKSYPLKGDLTIHGVTKHIELDCSLKMVDGTLVMEGEFVVSPEDYRIEIPKLVKNKIAKSIKVTFNYQLKS